MEDAATAMAAGVTSTPADGYWKTILNLFFEPSKAFDSLSRTRRWLIPLILCSLTATGYEAAISRYRMEDLKDRISHDSTLSQAEMSRRLGNIEAQRTTSISYQRVALGATLLTGIHVLKVIAVAAILWLSTMSLHNRATFGQLFSATSFIFMVIVPERLMVTVLMTIKGSYNVHLGPVALLSADGDSSALFRVLERLDIFSIWMAVLMAMALPIMTGISKRRAVVTAGCVWAAWLLLGMLPMRFIDIS